MSDLQSISSLRTKRVAPGSVYVLGLLVSFIVSLAGFVALSALYLMLDKLGIVESVNKSLADVTDVQISFVYVLWASVACAVWSLVVVPIVFALVAWVYNICSAISGGLRMEVTLR